MTAIRLGMLTPSSNTVLEPVVSAMVAALPDASVHFSRFPVTEISLGARAVRQFEPTELLRAATLLAHARVQVVAWNGTSSGWLGFETDERLCIALREATGVPACTSVLALNEILALTGARRIAFVTPYRDDVQAAIARNYEAAGFEVLAAPHLSLEDNFSFALVGAEQLRAMVLDAARSRPDAIAIFCTNLRGAPLVQSLEAETGIPIYDTVATAVWKCLRVTGVDSRPLAHWGSLFRSLP